MRMMNMMMMKMTKKPTKTEKKWEIKTNSFEREEQVGGCCLSRVQSADQLRSREGSRETALASASKLKKK